MIVSNEKGITLVLALLLLLVMTILGVAGLSSISMQERMASNANLQALAFEAASAGVNDALDWAFDMDADGNMKHWGGDGTCDIGEPEDVWIKPYVPAGGRPAYKTLSGGATVEFTTTLGCFLDDALLADTELDEQLPMQLLLLSRGEVRNVDGELLAVREVEVRLEPIGDDSTCLFTTGALDPGTLNEPNSNSTDGGVSGGPGGCALAVPPPEEGEVGSKQLFDEAMGEQRLSRWTPPPPVREQPLEPLWDNAENLAKALNAIKFGIQAKEAWDVIWGCRSAKDCDVDDLPPPEPRDDDDGTEVVDNNPFSACAGTLAVAPPAQGNQVPVVDICPNNTNEIWYIAGSLEAKSGCNIQGTVLIEDGLYFSGQGQYGGEDGTADLMIFGGTLRVNGFGTTRPNGFMTLLNLVDPDEPLSFGPGYDPKDVDLDPTTFDIRGMGNARVNQPTFPDCQMLVQQRQSLNLCLEALANLDPDFLGKYIGVFDDSTSFVGSGFVADDLAVWDSEVPATQFPIPRCAGDLAGTRVAISSWREYIDPARWEEEE